MSDFKVGDKVRRKDKSAGDRVYTVEDVSSVFSQPPTLRDIVRISEYRWYFASDLELIPPEKPKYRLGRDDYSDSVYAAFGETGRSVVAYFGPDEAVTGAWQAEAMVRAAMTCLGYEEAK